MYPLEGPSLQPRQQPSLLQSQQQWHQFQPHQVAADHAPSSSQQFLCSFLHSQPPTCNKITHAKSYASEIKIYKCTNHHTKSLNSLPHLPDKLLPSLGLSEKSQPDNYNINKDISAEAVSRHL